MNNDITLEASIMDPGEYLAKDPESQGQKNMIQQEDWNYMTLDMLDRLFKALKTENMCHKLQM